MSTDIEAVVYLMLMNKVLHDLFPTVVTIGEDVSGMPTFCRWALALCSSTLALQWVLTHSCDRCQLALLDSGVCSAMIGLTVCDAHCCC